MLEKFIESPGKGPREESLQYLKGKIQGDKKLKSAQSPEAFLQAGARLCNEINKESRGVDAIMLWTILNPEELRLKNAPPSERHLDFHRSLEGKNRGDEF